MTIVGNVQAARQVDTIFFDASNTTWFASDDERAAFRERWLGRYLRLWPELAFVAIDAQGDVAGYLVGCLDNPATIPLFDDIAYFKTFSAECARFPAHLHINLRIDARGHGTGARLIDAFVAEVRARGVPGLHIVTSKGARNVGFYERNSFRIVGETPWKDGAVVFMGREVI